MRDRTLIDLKEKAIDLLASLIRIPSLSREEDQTAALLVSFLDAMNIKNTRLKNNVFAFNLHFRPDLPTILLNSHHDTVKPNTGYSIDPFIPQIVDGKLYGLGSNDAGGSLVALLTTFLHYYHDENLKYNLCFAATAEEEISGINGMELFMQGIKKIHPLGNHTDDCAIIGEPTKMQMAVAEKGLVVLDATSVGKAGHAAREEGENALYKAIKDITWIQNYPFDKISDLLGPVKMSVTSICTDNKAHNVVPDTCHFTIDVRVNELYTLEEVVDIIQKNIDATVKPRSLRIRSSNIGDNHILVKSGLALGKTTYGSPTTSDKALVGIPALKMGPGDSARSHTADEYIFIHEIHEAIDDYISLISFIR
jgi:acetylornithine deacetylase